VLEIPGRSLPKTKLPTMPPPSLHVGKTVYRTFRELHGVVVTAGLMDKTVKVRVGGQKWNAFLQKVRLTFLT
jgi:hypothetical protein